MWIYKITNTRNNKVYIGQTIRPIEKRFKRHINDAINNNLDTHFARAIRKYGKNFFICEEIDKATTQKELTEKEQYWINFYNSIECGYNETNSIYKCGGNTYMSKTKNELDLIKEKISQTKCGELNPMSRKIKRTDIVSNEVKIYDTIISCAKDSGIKNGKSSITYRLNGKIKSPFKNRFIFEYYNE